MDGDLDEIARAELVERGPCPRCGAPPGALCRTNASSPSTTTPAATQRFPRSSPGPRSASRPRLGAWPRTDLAVGSALARAGDRIGYARVSSKGQDLAGQVLLLREAGCVWIHVENVGTRKEIRPEYNAALADLRPADTPTVTMLVRLGRNMIELITSAQDLAERDRRLKSLAVPCPASTTRRARAWSSAWCSPRWRRSSGSSSTSGP